MEEIRQNGKIILHSDDGTSIRMIFKNLTGRIFQGQEYVEYIRHIAIGEMGFSPGIIEHCRNDEVVGKGQSRMYESGNSNEAATSSEFPNSWDSNFEMSFVKKSAILTYLLFYISFHKLLGQIHSRLFLVH